MEFVKVPRQPAGAPAAVGGQFATNPLAKPVDGVDLTPAPHGSVLFPPEIKTDTEAVAFWTTVDVPDEVCVKLAHLYAYDFGDVVKNRPVFEWHQSTRMGMTVWLQENAEPAAEKDKAKWEQKRDAAQATFIDFRMRQLEDRPRVLNPRDVRTLVRASGLYIEGMRLGSDVGANHVWSLSEGDEAGVHIFDRLALGSHVKSLFDPLAYGDSGEMAKKIAHLEKEVSRGFGSVILGAAATDAENAAAMANRDAWDTQMEAERRRHEGRR